METRKTKTNSGEKIVLNSPVNLQKSVKSYHAVGVYMTSNR